MKTFKEMREQKGYITQSALAHELGVNRVNVTRWERGTRYPERKSLIKLEEVLGLPIKDILEAIDRSKEPQHGKQQER